MKINRAGKDILISLAVTLIVWLVFSWPLPRYASHAIPCSAYNVEKGNMRMMMPGDNLQLLYQFWLASDTFKGDTPWFIRDPYEFNTGNKSNETFYSRYYLPFSFFFTVGSLLGGQAFGYNFDAFLSLWLTYLFTWLLIRRYTRHELISGVAALLGIILPYRWITLLDGSPTGLGMMWAPIIFWALDVMVAEKKIWAGAVAGLGLCVSEWGDTHVFFFSVLSAPFWCLFSYIFHFGWKWPSGRDFVALLKSAIFLVVFAALIFLQILQIRHELKDAVGAGQGKSLRSFNEVAHCSPRPSGLVKFKNPSDSRKIYVGVYLFLLFAGGWGACIMARRRGVDIGPCKPVPLALLSIALAGIVMLALGTNNPGGGRAWKLLTIIVPPYGSIRQPDKIFCLMPVFLAVGVGMFLPCLLSFVPDARRRLVSLALVVPLLFDYKYRIDPTICGLDREQGAYRAVAEDAKASGNSKPHIIALPLWPGDSHFASINEYCISLYRLRMINGYGGARETRYMEDVFLPLESMNIGGIYDSQLDNLLKRGIHYIVLHEDDFPEKVSPFPAGYTLQQLVKHPRLENIGKDGAAWSFKIKPGPVAAREGDMNFLSHILSARQYDLEWCIITNATKKLDPTAISGACAAMTASGSILRTPTTMAALDVPVCWYICARGTGTVSVASITDGVTNSPSIVTVDSSSWSWQRAPAVPASSATAVLQAELSLVNGAVDLDAVILGAGQWKIPAKGGSIVLPAVCMFHAGYTEKDFSGVTFRKLYEADRVLIYGPKMPLEPGKYSAELVFNSAAPAGTQLGQFNVRWQGSEDGPAIPVRAGSSAVAVFEQKDNRPFFIAFEYNREADMTIRRVIITRAE